MVCGDDVLRGFLAFPPTGLQWKDCSQPFSSPYVCIMRVAPASAAGQTQCNDWNLSVILGGHCFYSWFVST